MFLDPLEVELLFIRCGAYLHIRVVEREEWEAKVQVKACESRVERVGVQGKMVFHSIIPSPRTMIFCRQRVSCP